MKRAWIALLVLALLMPSLAWAAPEAPETEEALAEAQEMLAAAIAGSKDFDERAGYILRAVELAPDDVDILMQASQLLFYIDLEEVYAQECEDMLRHALTLAKGKTRSSVFEALSQQLIYAERTDEAEALLLEAIEASPRNHDLKIILATVLYYADRNGEAIDVLDALIEVAPRNLEARRLRAAVLVDEYRWDEALEAYRQIEDDWPEYLDGLYGQYLTYVAAGEFEQGVRAIDRLLAEGAEDDLWLERARIRLWKQYMPERALEEAEALLRMDPDYIDASIVKMVSLLMLERYDEAREVAEGVEPLDLNQSELMLSIVEMNEEKWTDAANRLQKLLDREPEAVSAWRNLSMARLDGLSDVEGGYDAIREAFAVTGEGEADMDQYLQLGHAYRRQGKLEQAARSFAAANALTWEESSPLFYLAMTCIDAGHADDATAAVELLEARYPGWYETMVARILLEDAQGNADKALDAFEAYKQKYPFMAEKLSAMEALLMIEAGDARGVRNLKRKLEEAGDDARAEDWDTYAYALLLDGDTEAAEEALAQAEALMPKPNKDNAERLRTLNISLRTTRAQLLFDEGDIVGGIFFLQEAADLGWPGRSLMMNDAYSEIIEQKAYQFLLESLPKDPEIWDLTRMPVLPK